MKRVFIIACLVLPVACAKRQTALTVPPNMIEMVRVQTQCADPWGYGPINDATITRLNSYLVKKNISTVSIKLKSTGELNTCDACTCSRGFIFDIVVLNQYRDSLVAQGFTLK